MNPSKVVLVELRSATRHDELILAAAVVGHLDSNGDAGRAHYLIKQAPKSLELIDGAPFRLLYM
jgi:hypothetical protein